jgi:hypothetical protein
MTARRQSQGGNRQAMKKLVRLMPMRVLRWEKGDVLVMQTNLQLRMDDCKALRAKAQEQFGKDFGKIVILTHGIKLGILRKQAAMKAKTVPKPSPSNRSI